MRLVKLGIISVVMAFISMNTVSAHPGNTASDGCHYCRTNCTKWGVPWNARHCHGGYSAPTPTYTQPSCPANSTFNSVSKDCSCNAGYTTSLDRSYCIKVPLNAHSVTNATDVWECDYGYIESGNACIKDSQETSEDTLEENTKTIKTPSKPTEMTNVQDNEDTGGASAVLGLGFVSLVGYLINRFRTK